MAERITDVVAVSAYATSGNKEITLKPGGCSRCGKNNYRLVREPDIDICTICLAKAINAGEFHLYVGAPTEDAPAPSPFDVEWEAMMKEAHT